MNRILKWMPRRIGQFLSDISELAGLSLAIKECRAQLKEIQEVLNQQTALLVNSNRNLETMMGMMDAVLERSPKKGKFAVYLMKTPKSLLPN